MGPDSEKLDGRHGLNKDEYAAAFEIGRRVGENMKEIGNTKGQTECPGVFPDVMLSAQQQEVFAKPELDKAPQTEVCHNLQSHLLRLADQMDLVAVLMIGRPPRAAWDYYGEQLQKSADLARQVAGSIEDARDE